MGGGGSYNAVNGVPSCANDWLLSSTLRDSWRFDGYVTGDCGAVQNECTDKPHGHNFTGTNCSLAAALSVQAGTDVDCGGVYGSGIPSAVKDGTLKEADVDTSFGRLTKMQMRLGLFDADPYGLKILSVYMKGSKNMSYDAINLTTPDIKCAAVLSCTA